MLMGNIVNIVSQLAFILFAVGSKNQSASLMGVAIAFIVLCTIMHVVCFVKYPLGGEVPKRGFVAGMLLLEVSFLGYMFYAYIL